MAEKIFPATEDQLEKVQAFVAEQLEAHVCPARVRFQLDVAVEEIYVNIARYAYHPEVGEAQVRCETGGDPFRIVIGFADRGRPYNPLAKEDPDTTMSAEQREIGGLGIFMVKKTMDRIAYSYSDGINVLTIEKSW